MLETFSAATLVKKSASQIVYERAKRISAEPTPRMLRGSLAATTATKDSRFAELGGYHEFDTTKHNIARI